MHDRIAELAGLRAELAICEKGPRLGRRDVAPQVREEITRVVKELTAEVEALEARARKLIEAGQNSVARGLTDEVARLRAALGDDAPKQRATGRGKPGQRGSRTRAAPKAPEQT
jgi:hypothetical protein